MAHRPNRRITLQKPGASTQDSFGQVVPGVAVDVPVWAVRQDLQGDEAIAGSAERFVARVRWLVRRTPATEGLTPKWGLTGDDGEQYDVEAVLESDQPGTRRRWWAIVTRRTG